MVGPHTAGAAQHRRDEKCIVTKGSARSERIYSLYSQLPFVLLALGILLWKVAETSVRDAKKFSNQGKPGVMRSWRGALWVILAIKPFNGISSSVQQQQVLMLSLIFIYSVASVL